MNKIIFIKLFNFRLIRDLIFEYVRVISKQIVKSDMLNTLKWHQVITIPHQMVAYGYFDQLKEFYDVWRAAAMSIQVNRIDILKFYIDQVKIPTDTSTLMIYVAKYGRLEMMEYLHWRVRDSGWDYRDALKMSPNSKNFEVFICFLKKYLASQQHLGSDDSHPFYSLDNTLKITFECALEAGQLEIMDYLYNNYNIDIHSEKIVAIPLKVGDTRLMEWLIDRNVDIWGLYRDCCILDRALLYGNLELGKWIHEKHTGSSIDTVIASANAMDNAVLSRRQDIVEWLHYNRSEGCTPSAMDYASSIGSITMLQWFHCNRTEGCTFLALDNATQMGNIDAVRWLHENRTEGCSINSYINSIRMNYLEIFKFLLENRSDFPKEKIASLIIYTLRYSTEFLSYFYENYHYTVNEIDSHIRKAISNSNQYQLKWLLKRHIDLFKQNNNNNNNNNNVDNLNRLDI
ncbi:hypothetical protein PPL_07735 [Heterostelium album PN500]|uniref:Ankyrin repeat-containing protein n=1 Tax=Heterostelium pallidum (strain ATCC 26659 / Pp 5 / PN500) TaxID=670386 RepID=D3BGT3_HETP5|nr:hypothetical protein PPL_07735 [Heterostelium album PN500]EFA79317.1 hypothetical protein PPL_07735 [Heterostelium album PN500]|eukprot:XP_020431438.1 hypothetical protein PPL_07735 [Heterostelium album PN500]